MHQDKVKDAVLKVALGFSLEEVTEEYDARDGELKLVKRKETRKDVPPDLKAVKLLIGEQDDLSTLSDEQLETERIRLLKQLKEEYDHESEHAIQDERPVFGGDGKNGGGAA